MKKLSSLLAVAVLVLSLFAAACGGNSTTSKTTVTDTPTGTETTTVAPTSEPIAEPTTTTTDAEPEGVPDHTGRAAEDCESCHTLPNDKSHDTSKGYDMCEMCHDIGGADPTV